MTNEEPLFVTQTLKDATKSTEFQVVRTSSTTIYAFFIEASSDKIVWKKSTDNGETWSSETIVIDDANVWEEVAVWYDRWTPGDTTGNTVHMAAVNSTDDDLKYFSLGVDDDLPEADDNVVILAGDDMAPSGSDRDGHPTICKASSSGNLFAAATWGAAETTLTEGINIAKSTNGGTSWIDISSPASGYDWIASFGTDDDDAISLFPLKTDDDILAISFDQGNQSQVFTSVYDEVADTWDTPAAFQGNGLIRTGQNAFLPVMAPNKSNGDVYIVHANGTRANECACWKFSDSTRILTKQSTIKYHEEAFQNRESMEWFCTSLCRDETTGFLVVFVPIGEAGGFTMPVAFISSDDGKTWSHAFSGSRGFTADDFRLLTCPPVKLSTADDWFCLCFNDDTQDLGIIRPIPHNSVSGVAKDNSGTAISGGTVRVFRGHETSFGGMFGVGYYDYQGGAVTDGSGNYKVGVLQMPWEDDTYFAVCLEPADEFTEVFTHKRQSSPASTVLNEPVAMKFTGLTVGDVYDTVEVRCADTFIYGLETTARVAIYDDDGASDPDNLLGESTGETIITNGWCRLKLDSDATVGSDGILWASVQTSIAESMIGINGTLGSRKMTHTYGAFPAAWSSGSDSAANINVRIRKKPNTSSHAVDASFPVQVD